MKVHARRAQFVRRFCRTFSLVTNYNVAMSICRVPVLLYVKLKSYHIMCVETTQLARVKIAVAK